MIIDYKLVDINNVKLDKPEYDKPNKCYIAYFHYINNNNNKLSVIKNNSVLMHKLYIQTPKMVIASKLHHNKELNYYYFYCNFPKNNHIFYDLINRLDKFIINEVNTNSVEWFGVPFNDALINELYETNIKPPETFFSTPELKVKIKLQDDVMPNCGIFDRLGNKLTHTDIKMGSEMIAILDFDKVMFYQNKFCIEIDIYQMKICTNDRINNCMFLDDDDEIEQQTEINAYID